MANTLKIKRGTNATIPQGQLAEPLFTTDTYDLYIGKGAGGNQRIQNYIASGTSSQFLKGDGSLDSNTYQTALTFSSPLVNTSGTISIPAATGSVNGYLTSTDWTTFNSKEPAITAGTTSQYYRGDKTFQTLDTAAVPENGAIYFTEPRVRATVLTGLNLSGGGTIAATDSILTAFGKVQNQISALVGGATYQGTWNANTNTPTLASGTGTKGYYYVVSVAGSTNLDGITDWKIGDWAIFNGTTWDKVDNTDAVSSVNGFTGAVNLALDNISDVSAASPTNAQLLRFNGTSSLWENWTPTFEPALTKGNLTEATSSVLTITGGTGAVIGSGTTIEVASAGASQAGVVTTSAQTFAGVKTFSSTPVVPALHLADMTAGTGALYYNTSEKRLTLANYNTDGILMFEVNGGAYAMAINADKSVRMHGYTTNGFVKFTGANGTIGVDTTSYQPLLTNPVTGTGTNNYIPKFTATGSTIGDSSLYYSEGANFNEYTFGSIGAGNKFNNSNYYILSNSNASIYLQFGSNKYAQLYNLYGDVGLSVANTGVHSTFSMIYFNGTGTQYTAIYSPGGEGLRVKSDATLRLTQYTSNGFVKTSGGDGTLSVDTTSYLPLTGGTLTGALSGTSATFSSSVTATGGLISNGGSIGYGGGELGFNVTTSGATSGIYTTATGSPILYFDHRATGNTGFWVWRSGTGGGTTALTLSNTGAATFSSSVTAKDNLTLTGNYPSITLTATSGTNFYIESTYTLNRLSFGIVGSSTLMSILSNGNVGIGTTSPDMLLSVRGTNNTAVSTSTFYNFTFAGAELSNLSNTTNTVTGLAFTGGSARTSISGIGNILESTTLGALAFFTGGSGVSNTAPERMRITSGGNVGIGNTSPGARFHVTATNPTRGIIGIITNDATSSHTGAQLQFTQNSVADWVIGQPAATDAFAIWSGRYPSADGTERMRITSGGNVGIGTDDPQSSLHIRTTNATMIIQNSSTSAVGNISRLFYRALLSSGAIGYVGFIDGVLDSTTANTGYLKFHTYNNGNADERMRLTSGGNIELNGGSIKTGAPSGGTAKPWKFGARVAASGGGLNSGEWIELDVDGTLYKLALFVPL